MRSPEVDAYIAKFPPRVRALMQRIRRTIRTHAPRAQEILSYRIPAYREHGMLLYFAGFKSHIGFYPPVRGDARLVKAVARYAGPKGNLRFPYDDPLPIGLIARIVRHKVKQNRARANSKKPPAR